MKKPSKSKTKINKKAVYIALALILLASAIFAYFLYYKRPAAHNTDYYCQTDNDCTIKPAGCCGFPSCVNKDFSVDLNEWKKEHCTQKDIEICMLADPLPIEGCKCVENKCRPYFKGEKSAN